MENHNQSIWIVLLRSVEYWKTYELFGEINCHNPVDQWHCAHLHPFIHSCYSFLGGLFTRKYCIRRFAQWWIDTWKTKKSFSKQIRDMETCQDDVHATTSPGVDSSILCLTIHHSSTWYLPTCHFSLDHLSMRPSTSLPAYPRICKKNLWELKTLFLLAHSPNSRLRQYLHCI